jgi:hypothetical protein
MSMAMVLAQLVTSIVLVVSNSGTFSTADLPSVSLPTPIASMTVICNPAWGTIVLPICV